MADAARGDVLSNSDDECHQANNFTTTNIVGIGNKREAEIKTGTKSHNYKN